MKPRIIVRQSPIEIKILTDKKKYSKNNGETEGKQKKSFLFYIHMIIISSWALKILPKGGFSVGRWKYLP